VGRATELGPQNSWTPKLLSVLSMYDNFRLVLISISVTDSINMACHFGRKAPHIESMIVS
jgi:hypothetical protein